jgi:hypothetical protein
MEFFQVTFGYFFHLRTFNGEMVLELKITETNKKGRAELTLPFPQIINLNIRLRAAYT